MSKEKKTKSNDDNRFRGSKDKSVEQKQSNSDFIRRNSDQQNQSYLESTNSILEVSQTSIELDDIDPLEKEVFNQTLVYAAKSALRTIRSAKIDFSEKDNEGSVTSSEFSENDYRRLSNDSITFPLSYNKNQSTYSSDIKNVNQSKPSGSSCKNNERRTSSVQNVGLYTKMAERKKTIRRKESVILVPVKNVQGLKPEQIEEIKRSFNELDINKDGRVSRRELITGAYRLGMNPTDNEVDEMMKTADKNSDGFIDFNEYVEMMKQNYVTIDIERERMKAAFALLDMDGDGFLSKKELIDALVTKQSGITVEDIDEILKDADMDGNEQIDFNEFVDSTICAKLF